MDIRERVLAARADFLAKNLNEESIENRKKTEKAAWALFENVKKTTKNKVLALLKEKRLDINADYTRDIIQDLLNYGKITAEYTAFIEAVWTKDGYYFSAIVGVDNEVVSSHGGGAKVHFHVTEKLETFKFKFI